MRYVLDTSVAVKWFIPEDDSDKVLDLRDGFQQGVYELLAPELFTVEVANVLLMAERRGRISPGDGEVFLTDLLGTLPQIHTSRIQLLERAYEIAHQTGQTVYDCLYVSLAEWEGYEMVTADEKLVAAVEHDFPFVRSLSSI